MKLSCTALSAIVTVAALSATISSPANALSVKDCSAKYAAAKADGSAIGKSWKDFRKVECAAEAVPASTAKPAAKTAEPSTANETKPAATAAAPEKTATAPAGTTAKVAKAAAAGGVFPKAIATAYAQESAGKARLHTCLDQYRANKAANANGGLKWIQKGGGYYSECNKQLKG